MKRIEGVLCREAMGAMTTIIEYSAEHLESLRFRIAEPFPQSHIDTLSSRLFGDNPSLRFPSLTHVWLGAYTILSTHIIPLLINAAPNLILLDVMIKQLHQESIDQPIPKDSFIQRETKLRYLSLSCDIKTTRTSTYNESEAALADIISHSPRLQQISLEYEILDDDNPVVTEIRRLNDLTDLHCLQTAYLRSEGAEYEEEALSFRSLRQIVLDTTVYEFQVRLPTLTLYIN